MTHQVLCFTAPNDANNTSTVETKDLLGWARPRFQQQISFPSLASVPSPIVPSLQLRYDRRFAAQRVTRASP